MMTKVAQLIFDEGVEKGVEKGIEKGMEYTLVRCMRNMLYKGYEAAVIADLLEQKADYVEKVCSLIRSNPEDTDVEIVQKYKG